MPRAVQVKMILAEAIVSGLFPPGSRMPDSRQIATEVNAGLASARRALVSLVREGWLERDGFGHTTVKRPAHGRVEVASGGIERTGARARDSLVVETQAVPVVAGCTGDDGVLQPGRPAS
jgi:DNA-binding GntR family transcriptional regulator